MRRRGRLDGALGIILLLTAGPIVGFFAYVLWSNESDFFSEPSGHPMLLNWHEGRSALLVFLGFAVLLYLIQKRRGRLPAEDTDDCDKRYLDSDEL